MAKKKPIVVKILLMEILLIHNILQLLIIRKAAKLCIQDYLQICNLFYLINHKNSRWLSQQRCMWSRYVVSYIKHNEMEINDSRLRKIKGYYAYNVMLCRDGLFSLGCQSKNYRVSHQKRVPKIVGLRKNVQDEINENNYRSYLHVKEYSSLWTNLVESNRIRIIHHLGVSPTTPDFLLWGQINGR